LILPIGAIENNNCGRLGFWDIIASLINGEYDG
jgi:hypothetical protein